MFSRLSATVSPAHGACTSTAIAWRSALFTCWRHVNCEEGKQQKYQHRRRCAPKVPSPCVDASAAVPSASTMMKISPTSLSPPLLSMSPPSVKKVTRTKKSEEVNRGKKVEARVALVKQEKKEQETKSEVVNKASLQPITPNVKDGGGKVTRRRQAVSRRTPASDGGTTGGMRSSSSTTIAALAPVSSSECQVNDNTKLADSEDYHNDDGTDGEVDRVMDEESKNFMQLMQEEVVRRERQQLREQSKLMSHEDDAKEEDDAYLAQLEGTGHHTGADKSLPVKVKSSHMLVREGPKKSTTTDENNEYLTDEIDALNREQRRAVVLAREGHNLFITGGAGTGKSLVIREIVRQLRHEEQRAVFVTATTGVAALNVRGSTINSFAGVKFGDGEARELLKWVRRNRRASGRWKHCQTLIIDEISMMDPELLDKLDYIARAVRRCGNEPFGGIQVILCGDFLQLPPIPQRSHRWTQPPNDDGPDEITTVKAIRKTSNDKNTPSMPMKHKMTYCFQSEAWEALQLKTVVLHHKFRQCHDASFQYVLDDVRLGILSAHSQALLASRTIKSQTSSGKGSTSVSSLDETKSTIQVTVDEEQEQHVRLCATNREVESRNAKYFAALEPRTHNDPSAKTASFSSSKLQGEDIGGMSHGEMDVDPIRPMQVYYAHDECTEEDGFPSGVKFEDSTLPTELSLKVGTRVMLLQNISLRLGLVNGSVGEVVGFLHPLELVELLLRVPRERYHTSARGNELLQRGGFPTLGDAFRCVDTSVGQSLFWSLRQRGIRQPSEASYGGVYGNKHCRDVERLVGFSENESMVHPLEMYLGGITPLRLRLMRLPVVRLDLQPQHLPLGNNKSGNAKLPQHVYAFVSPSSHHWYMGDQIMATRTQIPLRQAWAITVHKAQGLTISYVEVSMHRFFSPGQAYVALSRSTRLENIRLLNFRDGSIRACPIAKGFHAALEESEEGKEEDV